MNSCVYKFSFHSPHNNEYHYKCTTCGAEDWCAYYDKFETGVDQMGGCKNLNEEE